MADFTKKAIKASFLHLLNQKPLKQISVRDIVTECGINRNTFYYHFRDIPSLVETIIQEESDRIIAAHPKIHSAEECILAVIAASLQNRTAVLHIYRSVNRDLFEQYQWRVTKYAVSTYLQEILEGKTISQEDRAILTAYIECVCFGVALGWLESGLQEDVQKYVHRICELKQGELERMIAGCTH